MEYSLLPGGFGKKQCSVFWLLWKCCGEEVPTTRLVKIMEHLISLSRNGFSSFLVDLNIIPQSEVDGSMSVYEQVKLGF